MRFAKLADRYIGQRASDYDEKRSGDLKWQKEQEAMSELLKALPAGSTVLDIPVGTGRFISLYQDYGLRPSGMDISKDMLERSREKAASLNVAMSLHVADIRNICAEDGSFDAAVCIRFLNWVPTEGFKQAVAELTRVSRKHLFLSVRHFVPFSGLRPIHKPENLSRTALQLARRVVPKRGLVSHEKKEVDRTFKDLRLSVNRAICVERRMDGTDFYIYHLTKDSKDNVG
jgi:ubiquinone/menaquinone biosynthesis C-methylase UbiE